MKNTTTHRRRRGPLGLELVNPTIQTTYRDGRATRYRGEAVWLHSPHPRESDMRLGDDGVWATSPCGIIGVLFRITIPTSAHGFRVRWGTRDFLKLNRYAMRTRVEALWELYCSQARN